MRVPPPVMSQVLGPKAAAAFTTRRGRLAAVRDDDRTVLGFPAVPATKLPSSPTLMAALTGVVPVWPGLADNVDVG